MKILIFMTQFYQLGGAERLGVELAEELNKRGIHADILSMYGEDLPGVAEAKETLLGKGMPNVHFLDMKIHPTPISLISAVVKLRRLIREHGYDVIETSMVSPTVIAAWATLIGRVRLVAGLHRVFKIDRENSKRHKFWRFSIRSNSYIRYYAISDYVKKAWLHYSNTPAKYTRTIYNAISNDCFDAIAERQGIRREFDISCDGRIALYVGRLIAYKGVDTVLNALGPILKRENLFLIYVGLPDLSVSSTNGMLTEMKYQITQEGWHSYVKFVGHRKDISRLMASADVLVHATQMEGFGLVLVEAMAAGLPVVSSNVEAIPEVLSGTNSIMVPPDEPKFLREAVITTLNRSSEDALQAIEKGCRRAEEFRIEKRVNAMVALFEEVLSENL